MATGYPALAIKQPEPILQQYGQAQQVVAGQQQMQMQRLQIQQEQQNVADQHALTTAMSQWDGQDPRQLTMNVIKNGGSGQAAMKLSSGILDMRNKASEIAKNDAATAQDQAKTFQDQHDALRGRFLAVNSLPTEQRDDAWDKEVTAEEQAGTIKAGQIPHQYPGQQQATALANTFALGSKLMEEENAKQKLAQEAWHAVGGKLVNTVTNETIGGLSNIPQLNQSIDSVWAVGHPGEKAPDQFHLNPGDGPEDFSRVDSLLKTAASENLTKAQQATVDAMRQQMFDMQSSKEGLTWITGVATQGPSAGKIVAVPQSDIQKYGIQDAAKLDENEIKKVQAGRGWLQLANKQGPDNEPDKQGIMQLINNMDKEGKLGPLAGRWNDFMAQKYGSGDPEYSALHTKIDLSGTLLGVVHTGRLGPYLLENLQSLTNAGKMDGPTLKAAFKSEVDYASDVAKDANPPDYSKQSGKANAPAQTGALKATHRFNPTTGKIEEITGAR